MPKQIASRAIVTYLIALITISVFFFNYTMRIGYIVLGLICVIVFFSLTSVWSKREKNVLNKTFLKSLFFIALSLRLIWVLASYFYYIETTGIPFEFDTGDALAYHEEAKWLYEEGWKKVWEYYFGPKSYGISDVGYPLYLTLLYNIFGPIIIIPRIIKAFLSAYTCVLIYRVSSRSFGDVVGRMAAIMAVFMPNLIIYCGYHLKETEMIFLEIAFLERTDYLIRSKKVSFWNVVSPTLLALSLFFFRTVLGAAAIFSFATVLLFSNADSLKRGWKRTALIAYGLLGIIVIGGGTIMTEVEALWEGREESVSKKRFEQTVRGNQWAQYATGAVMAPMSFVLPFSTMVDVDQQYAQQTKHGGNFIRNFMGFFALLAVYEAFRNKKWRNFVLIGSFVISYIGVVSLSGFSNSERFLLPGLPCLIMIWAYGVSVLRENSYRLLTPWCFLVVAMEFGWAFFKLGSRGLL